MDRAAYAAKQWEKERPDLDLLPMMLLGRLGEAALIIGRDHIEPVFARFGLKRGEFDVLATLRRSGKPYALTPTALYQATMISSGGMTNRLDRLEKLGLIERRPHGEDRRGLLVCLTKEGLKLIERAVDAHVENQKTVVAALSAKDQKSLNDLLGKLIGGLEPSGASGRKRR